MLGSISKIKKYIIKILPIKELRHRARNAVLSILTVYDFKIEGKT